MNIKEINITHNLYILKVTNGKESLIKLGYSSNIIERLKSYYQSNPLVELIGTYYRDDALEFELRLHKSIKSVVMREWYDENLLNKLVWHINNSKLNEIASVKLEDLYNAFLESENKEIYELEYPEFFEYEKYIAITEMNSLRWKKESIDKLLLDKKLMSLVHIRVYKILNNGFISSAELKSIYANELNKAGIKIVAKATLIKYNTFLYACDTVKKIDGKNIKGFEINKFRIN